jgi:nitroreductase/SAM-dependent methyltransferase
MTNELNEPISKSSFDVNEVLLALAGRKSFRRFLDEPLDNELVDQLIADSLEAPTACNHQMHHFVVVSDREQKKQLQGISGSNDHFLRASHLIVLCFHKGWNHNKFAVVQSTAALAYHLCLSAHLRGVGTVWNAGIGNTEAVRRMLVIPAAFEIIGVICLGWPDHGLENSKPPRRGLEIVRSHGVFNRPKEHIYPLRDAADYPYWRIKNNDNPFAVHDPHAWSLGQIREWRSHAVFAKSPTPGIFVSRRLGKEMPHEVAAIGDIQPGERILEVLPFAGSYTVILHERTPRESELHVAELSQHNLDFTLERLHNESGKDAHIHLEVMNDLRFPYEDSFFDAVLMPQVLEGLPDPWPLVEEALRVLRPGGRLGLSLRNKYSWFGLYFSRQVGKGQVTNLGPYLPVAVGSWRKKLSNMANIEAEWGVSPLPSRIGQRVHGLMTRHSRLWVARLRKLD